jgi:hypothetical protein
MEEPQQIVYRYTVAVGEELQISWHPASRVVHTAILYEEPEYVHFWVAAPDGELPFTRTFYIVGTGHPFPAADIVDGVAVYEGRPSRLVWQLVRREPGHTTN